MNPELFSEAMSEVNDKYYEEAAAYHCQTRRGIKFASFAACAAIVLAVSLATVWKQFPGQPVPQPDNNPPITTDSDELSNNTEQVISLCINEIAAPDAVMNNINLSGDDFIEMSYEELLTYFNASLPITETLPYLTLQREDFGVFRSKDRDIYYDGNSIVFQNSDGSQSIHIVLSKVFKHTYDVFDLREDELRFTTINGRELAIFHYKNESGAECYYAEFLQDDVAFTIHSENVSAGDYGKCLKALVDKTQQSGGSVHSITGEIVAIDPYANHIGIRLDEEQALEYSRGYGIDLPDGQSAGEYSLGDRIEVAYTGEPATILTIWAQQLVEITLLP